MAEVKIVGTTRTEFGKGASRRARRDGLVPAVIYGHGEKPLHITLPAKELGVALKQSNVLLDITIDGKNELTLPKVIVRDFLKQILEHVHNSIEVRVDAAAIPSFLEVDIQGLASGSSKYAADVVLPAGVELESDPKMIVVHLSEKSTAAAEETAAPVATDAAAPAADAEKKDA